MKGLNMIAIFILFASIVYSEIIWNLVATKKRPYEVMNKLLKIMVILNYFLSISSSSVYSFMVAAILSLYQMVIFKERYKKLTN